MNQLKRREFITLAAGAGAAVLTGCTAEKSRQTLLDHSLAEPVKNRFPIVLSSNENPFGPCPEALEAASRAVFNSSHLYAREKRDQLSREIADFYGLNSSEILLGCGAIELLKIATDVFCSARKPPIISYPVYEAMDYYAGLRYIGAERIPVKTEDAGHDLMRMLEAAYRYEGLIYLCNPCNPTGVTIGKERITEFIDLVPEGVIVVVDEAYAEYVGTDFFSCMNLVRSGAPNLIVVRTFSKIYGLAGLRVGYCAGNEELIRAMAGHRLWNNINQAGLAAARAALENQTWLEKMRRENELTKNYFCSGLKELGIDYIPSSTSFVLMSAGRSWEETHSYLYLKGSIVAGRKIPSLPGHIRISLGSRGDMNHVLSVLKDFQSLSDPKNSGVVI